MSHLVVTLKFTERIIRLEQEKELHSYPLYEGESGLVSGSALVTIPEQAMHFFETASNSLLWAIHFDGQPWWPFVPPMHFEASVIVGFWT